MQKSGPKTLSDNLNMLMAKARVNANELARRTGIPASSIKKIRNYHHPNPTLMTLLPLAQYFSITVSQLIGDLSLPVDEIVLTPSSSQGPLLHSVPIISWAEAAQYRGGSNAHDHSIATERHYGPRAFCLSVEEPAWEGFPKGTLLVIGPDLAPQHHDYVLVLQIKQSILSIKEHLVEDEDVFLKSILVDGHTIPKSKEHHVLGVVMEKRYYFRSAT